MKAAIIDRIESDHAILLVGENEIQLDVPRDLLQDDAKEGDWLNINFELDPEGEQRQREKIEAMVERLKQAI